MNEQLNWQKIIDAIPCLLWGVIVCVTVIVGWYLYLKYWKSLNIRNAHECKMKKDAFEREKEWIAIDKLKASTDEALISENKELKRKIACLKNELELEKSKAELYSKQLKLYKETLDQKK